MYETSGYRGKGKTITEVQADETHTLTEHAGTVPGN